MKITSVSVELSRKRSSNFQSAYNLVGLTADLEEGEDACTVVKQLQREAAELLLRMDGMGQRGQRAASGEKPAAGDKNRAASPAPVAG